MDVAVSAARDRILPVEIDAVEPAVAQKSDRTVGETPAILLGRCDIREVLRSGPPPDRDQELQLIVLVFELAQFREIAWIDSGVAERYLAFLNFSERVDDVAEFLRIDIARRVLTPVSSPGNIIASNHSLATFHGIAQRMKQSR
jgi:hypothetical protein